MGKQWYYPHSYVGWPEGNSSDLPISIGKPNRKTSWESYGSSSQQRHQKSRNKDTPVRMKSENKTGDTKKSRKKERERKKKTMTMRDRCTKSRKHTPFSPALCFPVSETLTSASELPRCCPDPRHGNPPCASRCGNSCGSNAVPPASAAAGVWPWVSPAARAGDPERLRWCEPRDGCRKGGWDSRTAPISGSSWPLTSRISAEWSWRT